MAQSQCVSPINKLYLEVLWYIFVKMNHQLSLYTNTDSSSAWSNLKESPYELTLMYSFIEATSQNQCNI